MSTRNLDDAIRAVSTIYCPHTVEVAGAARNIDANLQVHNPASSQLLVELSYGAPQKVDTGNFRACLFLMMHCARLRIDSPG
jgi:hypothetical protein